MQCKIELSEGESVVVSDSAKITRTYVGLTDRDGKAVLVEADGAAGLLELIRVLNARVEQVLAVENLDPEVVDALLGHP